MKLSKALGMALALALGMLVSWQLKFFDPRPTEDADQLLFPDLDVASVDFLSLTSKGRISALERTEQQGEHGSAQWLFTYPEGKPVDHSAVNEVISVLPRLKIVSSLGLVDEPEREEEFGLVEPKIQLAFRAAGKSYQIDFGNKHPFSGRRYARQSDSGQVYLIKEAQVIALDRIPFDLMNKTPLKFDTSKVREFWVTGFDLPLTQFVLERDAAWHVYSKGQGVLADSVLVDDMLARLAHLGVWHFVTVPQKALSAYGLRPPMLSLRIEFEHTSDELVVHFGATKRIGGALTAETDTQLNIDDVELKDYFKKDYTKAADQYLSQIEWSYYFKTANSLWSAKALSPVHRAFMRPLGEYRRKTLLADLAPEDVMLVKVNGDSDVFVEELSVGETPAVWTYLPQQSKIGKAVDFPVISAFFSAIKAFRVLSFPEGVQAPEVWENYRTFDIEQRYSGAMLKLEIGPRLESAATASAGAAQGPRFGRFTKGQDSPILFVVSNDVVEALLGSWRAIGTCM